MKLQKSFLTLIAALALVAGCDKEKEPEASLPVLNVGQSEISFEQAGGTASLTVTSNRPWTISTDADWLAFTPANGNASDSPVSVTVTALANTSTDRTAEFKVKTDFDFRTVAVSQKGAKGEDPNYTPSGSGTASDPYNVAAALEKAKSLNAFNNGDNLDSGNSAKIYTKGKVVSVDIDPSYGNATYFISADGTTTVQLEVYRGKYLGGKSFVTKDQLKAGDEVVVYGTIVNFKGDTPEYTTGSELVSINGSSEAPEIDYSSFELLTVANFIQKAETAQFYRLKGKVSRFNSQYCSFDLSDGSGTIYVYNVANKDEWASKISNGGTIELAGLYALYTNNNTGATQHEVVSAQILSFEEGVEVDPANAPSKTVADFISAADKSNYYKLNGTVSGFNSQYCSFDLEDATGSIYVYSVANKDDWSSKISNGGTVTLSGKYDYYSAKSQHEVIEAVILSFEEAVVEYKDVSVAEALEEEMDAALSVGPATVLAAASAGFLIGQDGAMIYVYGELENPVSVGDNVTVQANLSEYQEVPQLVNPKVTINSTGGTVTYPTPEDITPTLDTYSSDTREYVTFKGVLTISNDRYFNIAVDGATAVTGSIVKPLKDISSLNGKVVEVTGYYLYHTSQGKYLYIIATDIKGADGEVPGGGDEPGGDEPGGDEPATVKTVSINEFLSAEDSRTQPYQLTGKVSEIKSDVYGNFNLTDESGTVYVYGLVSKNLGGYEANKANDKSFASIGIKDGDEITIVGYRETYTDKNGATTDEVAGAYYVSGASGGQGGSDEPGGEVSENTETVDFSSKGYANAEAVSSYKGTNFSIAFDKGTNSNAPKYYNTGTAIRVYGSNNFTISSSKTITSIKFTFSSGEGDNEIIVDKGSFSKDTWTGSATSVKFTIGGTSGHRRIKMVAVTFAE